MLRTVVTVLSGTDSNTDGYNQPESSTEKELSIIDEVFDENRLLGVDCRDDDMCKFFNARSYSALEVDSLVWLKENTKRYPSLSSLAKNLPAAQASSMASELVFPVRVR